MTTKTAQDVLDFWFSEDVAPNWFVKSDDIDAAIRDRFADTYQAAHRRELDGWAETPQGALALVIVLDQFPRNLFRGSGRAFESNDIALDHVGVGLGLIAVVASATCSRPCSCRCTR